MTGAHRAPDGRAFTSDLPAQDFFRLLAAGAVPVAFVLGTCVYHIAHRSVLQSLRQAYQNQEMMQFTQGVYARNEQHSMEGAPALTEMCQLPTPTALRALDEHLSRGWTHPADVPAARKAAAPHRARHLGKAPTTTSGIGGSRCLATE